MSHSDQPLKIAVIGGGVAGVVASFLLSRKHDVTLIEANDYVGGHTNTIVIDSGPDAGTAVDTGFIVTNPLNYPLFQRFLRELNVPLRQSDMSFAYSSQMTGYEYGTASPWGLVARRRNLISPRFWQMMRGMLWMNRQVLVDLDRGQLDRLTLQEYLAATGYPQSLVDHYLIPMGAAIWSTSPAEMMSYPASAFFHFWRNHCLLQVLNRPVWQTVMGGSFQYINAFLNRFRGTVRICSPVKTISRQAQGVMVHLAEGETLKFDNVVIATHADQAYQLLQEPTAEETRLLGPWRYSRNRTLLHTDDSVMPRRRAAWASWNFLQSRSSRHDAPVMVTYHMNRLQGLTTQYEYFVTLNSTLEIDPQKIIREIHYTHPLFTQESLATQSDLPRLANTMGTYYCGSYHGYGFHEDAVRSAVEVAKHFGISFDTPSENPVIHDAPPTPLNTTFA